MSDFSHQSELNLPALNRLIAEFGLDARVDPERLRAEFDRDNSRVCAGCGCTSDRACVDDGGEPCAWVEGVDIDICTFCAEIAARMAEADEDDVARRVEEPRVQLYSEGDANRAIAQLRAGGAA